MSIVLRVALLAAVLMVGACRKEPAPQPAPSPATPTAPTEAAAPSVPGPEAATPSTDVSPTAAPEATSPTTAERAAEVSVALFIQAGAQPGALPVAGKPATLRVTPVDDKGQPVRDREPVMGAELVLVALRADLGHVQVHRAVRLSDAAHHAHEFKVTFPHGGSHVLYFLFKPKGMAMASVPVFIRVDGQQVPGVEQPERAMRFLGKGGLEVGLVLEPETPQVCQPVQVGTLWTRKGKPVPLQGPADGPRAFYVAVDVNLGAVVAGQPVAAVVPAPEGVTGTAAKDPADLGTRAELRFPRPGRYRLLAVADLTGGKAPQITVADFAFPVQGEAAAGGCP